MMDDRLSCEVRLTDYYRKTADVDAQGWKKPPTAPRYRVKVAKALLALATHLAPTERASPPIRTLAR
jgi:hypothetical protein